VCSFDTEAAKAYGVIRRELEVVGTPIGAFDLLIAAHALSLDLTVVTHNVSEFSRVRGLKIEDWHVERKS
jgi:tRNA(fMet)-specific endonuclease VapC